MRAESGSLLGANTWLREAWASREAPGQVQMPELMVRTLRLFQRSTLLLPQNLVSDFTWILTEKALTDLGRV